MSLKKLESTNSDDFDRSWLMTSEYRKVWFSKWSGKDVISTREAFTKISDL